MNERNRDGMNNFFNYVMMRAVFEDHSDCCQISGWGQTPLHKFCQEMTAESLRKYLRSYTLSVDPVDPSSGVTPLVTACRGGNLGAVKLLVQRGANVNHRCSGVNAAGLKYSGITPIYVAAEQGFELIVDYLARQGADVNVQMLPYGFTPVHRALFRKYDDVVTVLIERFKAKVSIPCTETPGSYPIFNAVVLQEYDLLEKMLLDAEDADPNVPEPTEQITPLHMAALGGDLVATEILIAHGADVNVQLKSGHTPLDLATREKARHVIEYLKSHGARRKVLDKSWQPFHLCVKNGLMAIKAAVNRGADVNAPLEKGGTALHYCITKHRLDACKFLLRKGANLESKDVFGCTPLHAAADLGLNHFVEFLLDKGANINADTEIGFTPLFLAARKGHYATCRLLLSRGADVNVVSRGRGTALHSAIAPGHVNIVKLLLKSGADPNANHPTEPEKMSPLHAAMVYAFHKTEIIRALVEAGANVNNPIKSFGGPITLVHLFPLISGNVEVLKILIEAGAFIDCSITIHDKKQFEVDATFRKRYPDGVVFSGPPLQCVKTDGHPDAVRLLKNTISLFKAVRKNDLDQAEKFFSQGGLVSCCSVRYDTPLIYASWKGYLDMVKFLLRKGAKIDMPNVQNSSPLLYAAKYNQKEVVIELLRAGASVSLKCCHKNPLELAQEHGHTDVARILEFVQKYLADSKLDQVPLDPNWKSDLRLTQLLTEFDGKIAEKDLEAIFGN